MHVEAVEKARGHEEIWSYIDEIADSEALVVIFVSASVCVYECVCVCMRNGLVCVYMYVCVCVC